MQKTGKVPGQTEVSWCRIDEWSATPFTPAFRIGALSKGNLGASLSFPYELYLYITTDIVPAKLPFESLNSTNL
jgi:hypothetical protein